MLGALAFHTCQTLFVDNAYAHKPVSSDEQGTNSASKGQLNMKERTVHQIVYHYHDASVPPQYHRSYKITVSPGVVRIKVDSYGDILVEKTYKLSDQEFDNVFQSFKKNEIGYAESTDDNGCTGGTGETIVFSTDQVEIVSGTMYHCGGKDTGSLKGDVQAFADDVRKLVPDLEELLQ